MRTPDGMVVLTVPEGAFAQEMKLELAMDKEATGKPAVSKGIHRFLPLTDSWTVAGIEGAYTGAIRLSMRYGDTALSPLLAAEGIALSLGGA